MFSELARKCRTARYFEREAVPTREQLLGFVDLARISGCAANLQRIRYAVIEGESAEKMYSYVTLGGYFAPEDRPTEADAAPAYIVLFTPEDKSDLNLFIDVGISAQVIMLAAADVGYSGCMIRSFNAEGVRSLASLAGYVPSLVIAIGKSREIAVIREASEGESLKYYKENGNHVVPKLSLESVLIK